MYISTCRSSKNSSCLCFPTYPNPFCNLKNIDLQFMCTHKANLPSCQVLLLLHLLSIPYTKTKKIWLSNLRGKTSYSLLLLFFLRYESTWKVLWKSYGFLNRYICDLTFSRSCNLPPRFYRFSLFHVEFSYLSQSQSKLKIRIL